VLPSELLKQRGLSKVSVLRENGSAWTYPVYTPDGKPALTSDGRPIVRFKAYDSKATPKYWWEPAGVQSERPKYYLMPDVMRAAINRAELYFVSGEPDVWTMDLAGLPAICCFGETQVPETLAEDLKGMGFTKGAVYIYPDRDKTGDKWANTVRSLLKDSGLVLRAYALPAILGDGGDLNKLWVHLNANVGEFRNALLELPPYQFAPEKPRKERQKREFIDTEGVGEEYYRDVIRALEDRGAQWKNGNPWSNHIECPMAMHQHDDKRPSFHYHREKFVGHCFKCGKTFLTTEIGDALNVMRRTTFVPPVQQKKVAVPEPPRVLVPSPPPPLRTGEGVVISPHLTEAMAYTASEASGIPLPLKMPFPAIANLGGLAELLLPGKMTAVIGGSGTGKTTFAESLADGLLDQGDGAIFGPEWTPVEYGLRAIQRLGGPSITQAIKHRAWVEEEARGIPVHRRVGAPYTADEWAANLRAHGELERRTGIMHVVQVANYNVMDVLRKLEEIIAQAAEAGRPIRWVIIDYVQLMTSGNDDSVNAILGAIKEWTMRIGTIHTIVTSQTTKAAQKAIKDGALLDQGDILAGRDHVFNLTLSINAMYDGDQYEERHADIGYGARIFRLMKVRVGKNSLGGNGNVIMLFDPLRMMWPIVDLDTIRTLRLNED
jgi:hypothetical protein